MCKNGKYGVIDSLGQVLVDYAYDDMEPFNRHGFAAIKKNGLWGSIDKHGQVTCEPRYRLLEDYFSEIEFVGPWYLTINNYNHYYMNPFNFSDYVDEMVEANLYRKEYLNGRAELDQG